MKSLKPNTRILLRGFAYRKQCGDTRYNRKEIADYIRYSRNRYGATTINHATLDGLIYNGARD